MRGHGSERSCSPYRPLSVEREPHRRVANTRTLVRQEAADTTHVKMRDRLLIFSTVQLLLFGAVFGVAYWQFSNTVLPTFERNLHDKAMSVASAIGGDLDVALATDDRDLAASAAASYVNDPDFQHLLIRTAKGDVLLEHGEHRGMIFVGPPRRARWEAGTVKTWANVVLEGVQLGEASITFSTARIDTLRTWARWLVLVVGSVWLLALVYSVWFARSFVRPLRAMMRFSRRVAGGTFVDRLTVNGRDELRGLQEDLNAMAADLETREAERRNRAIETAAMQQALVVMSRTAGKAEVATNVLHNVGNVLNSLNVSISVITDQLKTSKVSSLTKLLAIFEQTPGGITAFLATEKGKLLPTYLATLIAHLAAENATLLAELASATSNVDHIKTIIATQQSFADRPNMTETVAIGPLIDDALRMGEVSFSRHGIVVTKDYDDDVTVDTDRHRLLEILVNVVSNARHALKDATHATKRLGAQLRRTEAGISIVISDTGVGIAEDQLPRIFQHGFTTKPDGHGFGLHACANAAKELGGTISATSAGIGHGAELTIHLPLRLTPRGSHATAS